ncbi:glycosyltransferase family 4 protein [Microbulbifer agarilyticus]|uniref:glycosyltransferase family 4 protein n=1 Tax=Microbulbifer agarilyticus TaxID=260552 RepID=UPI001CD5BF75|nr:glycosyltransferase family 4 protein [Microbulbifer agarilyticus]MCA0893706.1 glycosyltransferase family 4 protein [Microbulbifer agarilyticus]
MKNIMFISHGHPKYMKGGAEVASWNLFSQLKLAGYDCLYVARTDNVPIDGSNISRIEPDQTLFHSSIKDWFNLTTSDLQNLMACLKEITEEFRPDIIHVHHYAHIGIEIFSILKQLAPKAKLIFTIHEYMAICLHNGQMVKNGTLNLCEKAKEADCHRCFPQHAASDFFLRKHYIQDQFSNVDHFISPSEFLANRYIEWGIPNEKFTVIENVLTEQERLPPRELKHGTTRNRFAFFGQINPYKGVDILLEALLQLPKKVRKSIRVEIHGANLEKQPPNFKEKILGAIESLGDCVILRGKYESDQLKSLMKETDWVVIPSIWWENSPVVIQEAIAFGRPLIGSNIGGMKEKIADVAGITFEARNPADLAKAMIRAIEPNEFEHWHLKMAQKSSPFNKHLELIEELLRKNGTSYGNQEQ